MMKRLALLSFLLVPQVAAAATVTIGFDGSPTVAADGQTATGVSEGFSYQTSVAYFRPSVVQLHDDGGILQSAIAAVDGRQFTALSLDWTAFSKIYKTSDAPEPDPYGIDPNAYRDYLAWSNAGTPTEPTFRAVGYRGGVSVAEQVFGLPAGLKSFSDQLTFTPEFHAIEALQLLLEITPGLPRFFDPTAIFDSGGTTHSGLEWCSDYCAEFWATSLTVNYPDTTVSPATVPVPATGILLGFAMASLLFGAWRQNSSLG